MAVTRPMRNHMPSSISDYTVNNTASPISHVSYTTQPAPASILKKPKMVDMTSSRASDTSYSTQNEMNLLRSKVIYSVCLSSCICVAAFLLAIISFLTYYSIDWTNRIKINKIFIKDVMKDCLDAAELSVIALSLATFAFSAFQSFFMLKMLKSHPEEPEIALSYIEKTSFLRMVVNSFWFLALVVFLIIILIGCATDNSRSMSARGVGVSIGVCALLLATFTAIKTICIWTNTTYSSHSRQTYKQFATLV
ncbi:unnamed protein product [Auanema sp. JU1783]|nr:unnamed protein product [Auanema sp. JU1783]